MNRKEEEEGGKDEKELQLYPKNGSEGFSNRFKCFSCVLSWDSFFFTSEGIVRICSDFIGRWR
ncbi:hypothetical protein [Halalkalibacter lacteus]|uniref:hypothetical protein n=1 Tax=Halalkalibacter lacteus TaxID=3090663 RepID=UPI002FCAFE83